MESMMNSNSMDAAPSSGSFGQQSESDIARSLKINPQSKTPYSDSTQVRPYTENIIPARITGNPCKKWLNLISRKDPYFL